MNTALLTQIVAGGVLGIGLTWMLWHYLAAAQDDRARADAAEGFLRSEREAKAAEADARAAANQIRKDAFNEDVPPDLW